MVQEHVFRDPGSALTAPKTAPALLSPADNVDQAMSVHALDAATLLKALSHPGRLMTLCHLASGEKSVTDLEGLLGARQAAVSQQLARLRNEGLVQARRDGKTIFYSIADARAARVMSLMYELYCSRP